MWEQVFIKSNDNIRHKAANKIKLICTIIIIAIVPLIVLHKSIGSNDDNLFSYYKLILWLTCVIILFFNKAVFMKGNSARQDSLFIKEIVIICFFGIVSFLLCRFKIWSVFGSRDRMAGEIFYFCFISTMYIISSEKFSESEIRKVITAFLISASIIAVISILQYYGVDILNASLIKKVIFGSRYGDLANKVIVPSGGTSYATMMNPNYLGGYMAIAYPVSLYFCVVNKNKLISVANQLTFCSLIFSMTRGAWVSAILAVLVVFIFVYRKLGAEAKHIIYKNILLNIIIIILALIFRRDSFSKIVSIIDYQDYFTFLILLSSIIYIYIFCDISKVIKSKKAIVAQVGSIILTSLILLLLINLISRGQIWSGVIDAIDKKLSDVKFLSGGSNRVVIWVNALPVLFHTILFGNGADTLIFYFNQNGFMVKALGFAGTIIDKPHNTYFDIWCDFGMIASISFFILNLKGLKAKFIDGQPWSKNSLNYVMAAGCFGWIFQAFSNDFFIGVACVYAVFISLKI